MSKSFPVFTHLSDHENGWMNWTETEWEQWVANRLEDRKNVYLIDPDDLISAYNREKSYTRDYRGREILELIQNADDAGVDYEQPNKILILCTNDGLIVANTGVPFSPDGIKSLMISDRSPKQRLQSHYIGHKGLGFRSILGWSSMIGILGHQISVQFSEAIAGDWLRSLRNDNPDFDKAVTKFENENRIKNPIPTLGVPSIVKKDRELSPLLKLGYEILDKGYDTVICLEYKNPHQVRSQVEKQISEITSSILLFLQNVIEIQIINFGKNSVWKIDRKQKNQVILNPGMEDQQVWRLFSKEGEIPPELLREDQIQENRYEIKLAIPLNKAPESRMLNVYFPTEIRFPYPFVAHATFELTGNRQHMTKSEANRFIAHELAELMVEVAEEMRSETDPWAAFDLLSPKGELDTTLQDFFHFDEVLLRRMKRSPIIPVRNKQFITPEKAKRMRGDFDDLLMGEQFKDLCLHSSSKYITQQLDRLNVGFISNEELKIRLNNISDQIVNLTERCELIFRLIRNDHLSRPAPDLLLDESGNIITAGCTKFLPPEDRTYSTPAWLPLKIINLTLVKMLREKFEITSNNELVKKLEKFEVQPYNLISIISAIVAEGNRQVISRPTEESIIRRDIIKAIWSLYSSTSGEKQNELPERINVILPTRTGGFSGARSLYFGKEYKKGQLLEYLYGNVIPDKFVSSPADMGIHDNNEKFETFLEFIGVASKPRIVQKQVFWGNDFYEMVVSSFQGNYPLGVDGYSALRDRQDLNQCDFAQIKDIQHIDHFEEVLSYADPHAIICWIALFSEVDSWRIQGDRQATFLVRPTSRHNFKKVETPILPSYPLWLLRTRKWLPVESGEKQSPSKCFLSSTAREISTFMGFPAIDPNHPLFRYYNLDAISIKSALAKVGVITEINDLSWDAFYEILLEHAEIDPEGTKARSLYRALITKDDDNPPPEGQKYQDYLKHGKVLARMGSELCYLPIQQVYYLDNSTIPELITENFALLELDRRRGTRKVKRMFGVEPLNKENIQLKVKDFTENLLSHRLKHECKELMPFVYALRVLEDSDRSECRKLKNFEIVLCNSLKAEIETGGITKEIEPMNGDSIHYGNVDFLVYDNIDLYSADRLLTDELLADIIGEVITNHLNADISDKIARLATCSPIKRATLLDKIIGGSGEERLKKAAELLDGEIVPQVEFGTPIPKAPKVLTSPPESVKPSLQFNQDYDQKSTYHNDDIGTVSVLEKEHQPSVPRISLKKRVKLNSKPTPSFPQHRRMDPDLAENVVMRFEEAEGRYPIKVSHIQGFEGYGCDLLSFGRKEDMSKFYETYDLQYVTRFIEVKGSSRESGSIVLKGNELKSAIRFADRFFLYRVYQHNVKGKFDIITLNNPISANGATEIQYEINPFRTSCSSYFVVEELADKDEV
ncbi:sacsin N-terminal ATP-binding-like domain-containing protein [Brevibacillus agri]|uniref:sacsin N-terminal ATP-binding-like domain-containing protein n=1 Tax=Brevibacillus agri TaxID=51101 RepID=UPI0018CD7A34|nr:DUF3883 domain-containing protein [Brevibacillus agri]MBG9564137.1 hypothetical protein [Brevibacillus agri]